MIVTGQLLGYEKLEISVGTACDIDTATFRASVYERVFYREMKQISIIAFFLSCGIISAHAEFQLTLAAECFSERTHLVVTKPGDEPIMLRFQLGIKNTGIETIVVPTSGFSITGAATGDSRQSSLIWEFSETPGKSRIIPSESSLNKVVLFPGETASIVWTESEPLPSRIKDVQVDLHIARDFATRFGLWGGDAGPVKAQKQ